jgi:hypothetical protein
LRTVKLSVLAASTRRATADRASGADQVARSRAAQANSSCTASNELVRRALAPYPDGLVIATKVGPMLGPDSTPTLQATPGQLRGLVEDNLRELGADHLDLVYLRVGGRNPAASRLPNGSPRWRSCAPTA